MPFDANSLQDLQETLVDASHVQPTVAVVWASWCGPCKSLKPKLEALCAEYQVPLTRIDGGTYRDLALHLGARAVPTIIVFNQGKEVARLSGDHSKDNLHLALMKAGTFQKPLP
jgi:thioredoxin-like negative regulator of GroEL